ncbi:MAG: hypothetical protein RIS94_311 [Pseudomonadota bacterium]|jgi:hypothetical protein
MRWAGTAFLNDGRLADPAMGTIAYWEHTLKPLGVRLRHRPCLAEIVVHARRVWSGSARTDETMAPAATVAMLPPLAAMAVTEGLDQLRATPEPPVAMQHTQPPKRRVARAQHCDASAITLPSVLAVQSRAEDADRKLAVVADLIGQLRARPGSVPAGPSMPSVETLGTRAPSPPGWLGWTRALLTSRRTWAFLQRALDTMTSTAGDACTAAFGQRASARALGPLTLAEARRRQDDAPEQAAVVYLGLLHKFAVSRTDAAQQAVLDKVARLPLAPWFAPALEAFAANQALASTDRVVSNMMLRAISIRPPDPAADALLAWDGVATGGLSASLAGQFDGQRLAHLPSGDLWIMDNDAPLAMLAQAVSGKTATIMPLGPQDLAATIGGYMARYAGHTDKPAVVPVASVRVRAYSPAEDALSRLTAQVAHSLVSGVIDTLEDAAPDWAEALELPIDDLLFSTVVDFWSVLHHVVETPNCRPTVLAGRDLTLAFHAGMASFGASARGRVVLVTNLNGTTPDLSSAEPLMQMIALAFDDGVPIDEHAIWRKLRGAAKSTGKAAPITSQDGDATLLIGRNFDRNYGTDLVELGRELRQSGKVVFLPTAGQPIKGRITTFVDSLTNDWCDSVESGPAAMLWAWPMRLRNANGNGNGRQLLRHLVEHAVQAKTLDMAQLAIVLAARARLEQFFDTKIYNHLKAGTETARTVATLLPRHMALLPGRDFIARVAAISGRAHAIPSFDVQTVFVGPRSRYKPTIADIQFTIETHSQSVFCSYFGLAPERTALTGCSKVGVVQEQARALDHASLRAGLRLTDEVLLVFAGSPFLAEDEPILTALAETLGISPDCRLGIRLHPTAEPDYAGFCANLQVTHPGASVLDKLDLAATMIISDILITRFSNVGLEAALLGKDVIACNFARTIPPISLDRMGVATAVHSPDELRECIADFRAHGPRWRDLQRARGDYVARNGQLTNARASANMRKVMETHPRHRGGA